MAERLLDEEFLQYLSQGRFMVQRSRLTGEYVFPPRYAAPRTGMRDLEWTQVSGLAKVYATTVVRVRPPQSCFNVALIELAEGPRLMSRVEGIEPEAVRIGMEVTARITDENGKPLLVFDVVNKEVGQ